VLDFGCGVRFARTFINLGLPIRSYTGIDANKDAIAWMQANVADKRFTFGHIDQYNPIYNPNGAIFDPQSDLGRICDGEKFDLICMISVITHQVPDSAARIFSALRALAAHDTVLYFTAFFDDTLSTYAEGDPEHPCLRSTYNPRYIITIIEAAGWRFAEQFNQTYFQQPALMALPQ
jgi:SAM-dependent methyltransferase